MFSSEKKAVDTFKQFHNELIHLKVYGMSSMGDLMVKFGKKNDEIKQIMKKCQKDGLVKSINDEIFMLSEFGRKIFDIIDEIVV